MESQSCSYFTCPNGNVGDLKPEQIKPLDRFTLLFSKQDSWSMTTSVCCLVPETWVTISCGRFGRVCSMALEASSSSYSLVTSYRLSTGVCSEAWVASKPCESSPVFPLSLPNPGQGPYFRYKRTQNGIQVHYCSVSQALDRCASLIGFWILY